MKWIWTKQEETPSFSEFRLPFSYKKGRLILKISAEYRYIAYINGVFVGNGQYPDVPWYKVYDEIDVTRFAVTDENELRVQAFHMGIDGQTARADTPCVAFELYCDDKLLAASSEDVESRKLIQYSTGAAVTPQLGYGFRYDFTAQEMPWEKSVLKQVDYVEVPRPVLKTKVEKEARGVVSAQGVFMKIGGNTDAEVVQNCWMKTVLFDFLTGDLPRKQYYDLHCPVTFSRKEGDGLFIIVDLGRNTVGFPSFEVSVQKSCKAYLCWGEHLQDLRIRSHIGGRNFAYGFVLKEGKNDFVEYFRRIGGRYIGFYVESDLVTVGKIGMMEAEYPLEKPEKNFGDRLLNKIYETARRTMELCIHDFYEDCPWREQALYGGDSRFQMKFGYGAFREFKMPRESLRFMALCSEEDGLIPLCAPSRVNLNIPSFSLYWVIALYEYIEQTNDLLFLTEMLPYAEKIMQAFEAHTTQNGITTFGEKRYWNFHEWVDGLVGPLNGCIWRKEDIEPEPDGALTALGVYVTTRMIELYKKVDKQDAIKKYTTYKTILENAVETFYDSSTGLYRSYYNCDKYHAYVNALVLASGVVTDEKRIAKICDVLKHPEAYGVVDMSIANLSFKYDVLIKYADALDFVMDQICEVFGGMLFNGATSFWETVYGEMDFGSAGSLCHGWSAVACYILDRYYQPLSEQK